MTTAEWVHAVNVLAAEIDRRVALGADLHSQELCTVSNAYAAVCRATTQDKGEKTDENSTG